MPHSIKYRPDIIDEVITNERLDSYRKVFPHGSDAELVGAYLWNINVCSKMYPIISSLEIAARNSIDRAIVSDLGRFWWRKGKLHYKSFNPGARQEPYPVPSIINCFSRAYEGVLRDKRKRYGIRVKPTHGEVVSKTDFATWEFILNDEFIGNGLIWPKNAGKAFRGDWKGRKTKRIITDSRDILEDIRSFRNRVFHHEPAWKVANVNSPEDAVKYLNKKIDKIESLIGMISKEKLGLIEKSGAIKNARIACSLSELERLQYKREPRKINSMKKLKDLVHSSYHEEVIEKGVVFTRGKKYFFLYGP